MPRTNNTVLEKGHFHARNPEPIQDETAIKCIRLACGPVRDADYDYSNGCMYLVAFDDKTSKKGELHKYMPFKPQNFEKAVIGHEGWTTQKYYISGQQVYFPVVHNGVKKHSLAPYAYRNIVVDIDCHNANVDDYARIELLNTFIQAFDRNYVGVGLVPEPNFIVHTPRGIHLWWCLIPTARALEHFWKRTTDKIVSYCQECLSENQELVSLLDIDETSSKRSGLYRLPGSYDPKHQVYCYADLRHENRISIFDCLEIVDPDFKFMTREEIQQNAEKRQTNIEKYNSYLKYKADEEARKAAHSKIRISFDEDHNKYLKSNNYRMRFADYLIHIRNTETGTREVLLFAYYNAAIQSYPPEMANEKLTNENQLFKTPLAPDELTKIIAEFKRRDKDGTIEAYNYSTEHWFELVQATPEEIEAFGRPLPTNGTRDKKRKANKMKKEERNKHVLDLHNKGLSIREIAKAENISTKTVLTIIHSVQDTTDDQTDKQNNANDIDTTKEPTDTVTTTHATNQQPATLTTTTDDPLHRPHLGLNSITTAHQNHDSVTEIQVKQRLPA